MHRDTYPKETVWRYLFIILFMLGGMTIIIRSVSGASILPISLPAGFEARVMVSSGLDLPLDFEFMPDGNVLVAEKGQGSDIDGVSHIKLVKNETVQATPVLTLSTNVYWDSGLLAFKLDPNFTSNGFLYVWYATGENAFNWSGTTTQRLSRFTYNFATETADLNSEAVMFETNSWSQWHHGNAMMFDDAGYLYLGIGEQGLGSLADDLTEWPGKVIRIKPTPTSYSVPTDNPFVGSATAKPEIFAQGFRNPYRMVQRASDGRIVLGDVGGGAWEEVNTLEAAGNYGWPHREGPCPIGEILPCNSAPTDTDFVEPDVAYEHVLVNGASVGAVTGLAFYEGSDFPTQYHEQLFFVDLVRKFIATTDVTSGEYSIFATGIGGIVDMEYHDERLYVLGINSEQLIEIGHVDSNNVAPAVSISADTVSAPAPYTVNLLATVLDPDDSSFIYFWDFGDGITTTTISPAVAHTYTVDGNYEATLKVIDTRGAQSALATIDLSAYSAEYPILQISNLTAPTRTQYHAGDTIQYSLTRSTTADLDPIVPYTWRIDLHHNVHTHPLMAANNTVSDTITIPTENHDSDWNLWYEFTLIMHTSSGQDVFVTQEIFPAYINETFITDPAGGVIELNDVNVTTPHTLKSIVGIENKVVAPVENWIGNDIYGFSAWEYWSTNTPTPITTTNNVFQWQASTFDTNYSAEYSYIRSQSQQYMPIVFK